MMDEIMDRTKAPGGKINAPKKRQIGRVALESLCKLSTLISCKKIISHCYLRLAG